MNARILTSAVILFFFSPALFALTGREILEKNDALARPDSARAEVLMIIGKEGGVTEMEYELLSKRTGNETATLLSFTRPAGVRLLTVSRKGIMVDQWLRLSSVKIKRIGETDRDQPFVNSHMCYEDLAVRGLDEYDYRHMGDTKVFEDECYRVEAVKKAGAPVYDRMILSVRKSDYFIVRADLFRKGEFYKFVEYRDVRPVQGILTAHRVTVTTADGKGKTELRVKRLEYNVPVRDSSLSREALR